MWHLCRLTFMSHALLHLSFPGNSSCVFVAFAGFFPSGFLRSACCRTCFWIFCEASSDSKEFRNFINDTTQVSLSAVLWNTNLCSLRLGAGTRAGTCSSQTFSGVFSQCPTTATCVASHQNIPNKLFSSASCHVVQSTWLFKGDCKPRTNINLFPRIWWHWGVASTVRHVPTNCSTGVSESHQAVAPPGTSRS